jgi:3'-phosphoadenosine 5'-phosphosulfate sulfotransferase (PAPS reductase)/FAD synthetase
MLTREQQFEALYNLKIRQAYSLELKVETTLQRIKEFDDYFSGNVYVAFSGGKDSAVLLDLARKVRPDMPAVFVNTGLEYPETVRFVKERDNVTVVRPRTTYKEVVETDDWPIGSKMLSEVVERARAGKPYREEDFPLRWRFLLDAPFKISDRCCHQLKIYPQAVFQRQTGRRPIIGTLASDSYRRKWSHARAGGRCNNFSKSRSKSAPMAFWTTGDVLAYARSRDLPLSPVYGRIEDTLDGRLATTGCRRTGCIFCCFGLQHERDGPGRFERLARTHPFQHAHVMNKLGLRDVLAWIRANAPASLRECFKDGLGRR